MLDKTTIRQEVLTRRKIFSSDELCQKSFQICSLLEQHERFAYSSCVMLYYPLPGEVDITSLLDKYYTQKVILLPVVTGKDIFLKQYRGKHNLVRGQYGIMEPSGNFWDGHKMPELIIVPGMAFDSKGHRLGRGKGFYDRFLSKIKAYKIGVCFNYQIFPLIPTDEHDIGVDEVIFD